MLSNQKNGKNKERLRFLNFDAQTQTNTVFVSATKQGSSFKGVSSSKLKVFVDKSPHTPNEAKNIQKEKQVFV